MARTSANFLELLWDLARMQGLEPDASITDGGLNDVQAVNVLLDLNRGYQRAYTWNNTSWEDGWTSAELTPVDGVVTFAMLGHASQFTLWTEDPRPNLSRAAAVKFKTSDAGLHVQSSAETVYGFWLPVCPRFVSTAYNAGTAYAAGAKVLASDGQNYVALQAGTGNNPLTATAYWRVVPVIEVLREAALNFALANYYTRTGEHGTAQTLTAAAEALLEDQAALEFPRVQTWWWIRRN